MRRRPWPLVILAVLHVLSIPFNFLMNAFISDVTLLQKWQQWTAPAYRGHLVFYVLAPIVAGVAIYICKRWSFWLYVVTMLAIGVASSYGYQTKGGSVSVFWLLSILLLDVAVVLYFFIPAVRTVYFDPRLRWWETLPRYKTEMPGRWTSGDSRHEGSVLNFSVGGLFFKADIDPADDTDIEIQFAHDGRDYAFKGRAIRHSLQNRMGFGVKFNDESRASKDARELVKVLATEGRLMTNRLSSPDDSLASWLKTLFGSGKGLVPEAGKRNDRR